MSYTTALLNSTAQQLAAALPGLNITVARGWVQAEQGAYNNPLGLTAPASALGSVPFGAWTSSAKTRYLIAYPTQQAGVNAAAAAIKKYYPDIIGSLGGSATQQASAIAASRWNTGQPNSPYYTRFFTSLGLIPSVPKTSTVPKAATTPKVAASTATGAGGLTLAQWVANVKARNPNSSASAILATAQRDFAGSNAGNTKPTTTPATSSGGTGGNVGSDAYTATTAVATGAAGTTDAVPGTASWFLGIGKGAPGYVGTGSGSQPFTQDMLNTIMGDVPVDNPNRAAILAGLTSLLGKPANTVPIPSNWTDTPTGGWQNFWGGQAGVNGSGGGLGNSGIGAGKWWTNPTFILYAVGGILMILVGVWIFVRNSGGKQTINVVTGGGPPTNV